MKFSICIPNYNYEKYLGKTLDSVFSLLHKDFEVTLSDNASTDSSVEIIRSYQQKFSNVLYRVNSTNVGFAGNLDKAASLATGDYMIMLSSDDLITPEALTLYNTMAECYKNSIICSSTNIITSEGVKSGYSGPDPAFWTSKELDQELSTHYGCSVYRIRSAELLKRCLLRMGSPFNFCTVAYPKSAYTKIDGYGATRLINPDKWYHWKLMTVTDEAIFIDKPLFEYRWHNQNQTAQQANSGHLKYLLDEYRSTVELPHEMLTATGLQAKDVYKAFVKYDICRHAMGEFSKNKWLKSVRVFFFGVGTYPVYMLKNATSWLVFLLLLTTPLGAFLVSRFKN